MKHVIIEPRRWENRRGKRRWQPRCGDTYMNKNYYGYGSVYDLVWDQTHQPTGPPKLHRSKWLARRVGKVRAQHLENEYNPVDEVST